MIDKVIICGVRRAKEKIEIGQIQQSLGRAGRSYSKSGEAIILCPSSDLEYAESCLYESSPPITSQLSNLDSIAFHILPWLDRIYNEETFQNWFNKSLSSLQGNKFNWDEVSKYLLETNCIDEEYNITEFGNISIKTYYSPNQLIKLKDKLLQAKANDNIFQPLTLSYILANQHITASNVNSYELYEYKSLLSSYGYFFEHGELMHGYAYYCIFTNTMPKWIKHVITSLKEDFSRTLNALSMIAISENLKQVSKQIKVLEISVMKKITIELANIMNEFSLQKKSSAYELKQLKIFNKQDLIDREDYVITYATQSLKNDLQKQGFLIDLLVKEWRNK